MSASNERSRESNAFAQRGAQKRTSSMGDFFYLLKRTRKWWMLPLILILLGLGVFMVLSSSGVAPFIYTVF